MIHNVEIERGRASLIRLAQFYPLSVMTIIFQCRGSLQTPESVTNWFFMWWSLMSFNIEENDGKLLTFDTLIDTQWMSWNPRIWVLFFGFLVLEPGFSKSLTKVVHLLSVTHSRYPVHVLEKETVYMKNNMEIKITEIKNDTTLYTRAQLYT